MSTDVEQIYRPGVVIGDKYRIDRVLGVGGFGIVVAATHLTLEEKVAVKVLLPEAARNPAAAERFLREAKAAVRIRSEHVARVTDVGTFVSEGQNTPYMVMEYLEGCDLSTLVKTRGGQQVNEVCEWVLQACEAIAEAHGLGIIHRDLKPANLFLTRRVDGSPSIKVLDFGISKLANEADKGMTKSSDVMGSPYYMSPEQMRSTRGVDVRTDIWSLGTIVFELLAGQPPFDGETMTALIVSIMQEPPRDLRTVRSDVPPEVHAAAMRCLEKDPTRRFANVLELASALAPFAHQRARNSVPRIAAALGQSGNLAVSAGISSGDFGRGSSSPSNPQYAAGSQPPRATEHGVPHGHISGPSAPAATLLDVHASSTPQASWAGTYAGKKPSRWPLVAGIAFASLAAGVGITVALRYGRAQDAPANTESATGVAKNLAASPGEGGADAPETANVAPPPPATDTPKDPPATTAKPTTNGRPPSGGGRPSVTPTSAPTSTPAPPPTVTPTPPPPMPPPSPPPATATPTAKPPKPDKWGSQD